MLTLLLLKEVLLLKNGITITIENDKLVKTWGLYFKLLPIR